MKMSKFCWRFLFVCSIAAAMVTVAPALLAQESIDCTQIEALGIDKQMNLHAAQIRVACGLEPAGSAGHGDTLPPESLPGGANANVVTDTDTWPHVTQSESMIAIDSFASTIVVSYNDSHSAPSNYSGVSYSLDGGSTWTRILPSPFATGHGTNYGDPIISWNDASGVFVAGDLVSGDCGPQGIGVWTSPDAINWTVGGCAHVNNNDDRESMWVDNNSVSPFYGRVYVSFNNFSVSGAPVFVVHSDDAGATWSAPIQITPTGVFRRNIQLTGSPDGTGVVYLAAMDEGGGGFSTRQNLMYRSFDGGNTWLGSIMGARFGAPGDSLCPSNSYFVRINPIWRHMGWGQPAAGPNSVLHYVYAASSGTDFGEIYYQRSLDDGATWSAPLQLTSTQLDSRTNAWMPSLSSTATGNVQAAWYDRHYSPNGLVYRYMGSVSPDNGATWEPVTNISDRLSPEPEQPDPNVQACYAGDYNNHIAFGNINYMTWTDGRNYEFDPSANVHFVQKLFFASNP